MLGVGIRIQIHFVHVWLKKKNTTKPLCFEAVVCCCPFLLLHSVLRKRWRAEPRRQTEVRYSSAVSVTGRENSTDFLTSVHNQDRLERVVQVKERARTRSAEGRLQQHVVYLVARNFWFFQGMWIYPLQWDKTGHCGFSYEKFLLLSQWKARKKRGQLPISEAMKK